MSTITLRSRRTGAGDVIRLIPWWGLPLRFAAAVSVYVYVHLAYRIRRWGALPPCNGPALIVSNHQIDLDLMSVISAMGVRGGWRSPLLAACARLLYEPGFMAERVPWLRAILNGANCSGLFRGLGFLPIENELQTRSLARWAYNVQCVHGALPLDAVFSGKALRRFGVDSLRTCDVLGKRYLHLAQRTAVKLSELQPPHRTEQFSLMRKYVDEDLQRIEGALRHGSTFHITPEGEYSRDGRMLPFRAIWKYLSPLADKIYLAGVSYDPFVSRRLTQHYRIVPLEDRQNVVAALKLARPVTVSALLCSWLAQRSEAFTDEDAVSAVASARKSLSPQLFVDPEFDAAPVTFTRRALRRMSNLGVLERDGHRYVLTQQRRHASFPDVTDIVHFQAAFLRETIDAASTMQ